MELIREMLRDAQDFDANLYHSAANCIFDNADIEFDVTQFEDREPEARLEAIEDVYKSRQEWVDLLGDQFVSELEKYGAGA